jgi:2-hydroxy-6-oxonona-2,4-dienedioate hydrolase
MGDSVWLRLLGTGFRQAFHDAGGVRTRVLEAGEGPPLILLHGTGGHAEAYHRNLAGLAEDFHVYAVDMLGHGYTGRPDVAYSHDDFAGHVVDLMDALGVERAFLSGESLGASVAGWIGITRPERVARLVMNTGVMAHATAQGLRAYDDLVRRTRALADDLSLDSVRHRMRWLVHDPDSMTEELVAVRHRIYSQPGMMDTVLRVVEAVVAQHRGTYQGVDYMRPGIMRELTMPTLIIWSSHNPGKSVELARAAAEGMKDVRIEVFTRSGHWPQYEEPERFDALHREFLLA